MDNRTMELTAIGASVTAHCQPCLTYHVGKAREMGIDEQEIREAIAVGHKVEKGSMSAMRDFAQRVLDSPTQDNQDNSACCTGKTSPDGKSCCS
jgi:AhpD family alkylhydroperoxidase